MSDIPANFRKSKKVYSVYNLLTNATVSIRSIKQEAQDDMTELKGKWPDKIFKIRMIDR